MADEESQEISSGGGNNGSQETQVPAAVVPQAIQKNVVAAVEATREKFESLKKTFEGVSARIDFIHKFMLDLGNYFFAFQGVCLAAMSSTSFFVCHNAWVLTLLSILSAIPSLASLGFLAHEWVNLMEQLDNLLANLDAIRNVMKEDCAREFYSLKKYYSFNWIQVFSHVKVFSAGGWSSHHSWIYCCNFCVAACHVLPER